MRVFLVRHADAGERESWRGPDRTRPLSEKGARQAEALAAALEAGTVERVLSSPYLRCVQTLQPLAGVLGLEVEHHQDLAEGADPRRALGVILAAEVPTAMCSQGDVIGGLITRLATKGVVGDPNPRWQKASTWVLEVVGREVTSAVYQPPPQV